MPRNKRHLFPDVIILFTFAAALCAATPARALESVTQQLNWLHQFLLDPLLHKDLIVLHRIAEVCLAIALPAIAVWLMRASRNLKRSEEQIRSQFHEISRINATLEQQIEKRTEALRESENQFRKLFDLLPVGVTLTDKSGQIIKTNPASESLLGIPADDMVRRNFKGPYWSIIRPDGSDMPQEEYASVRAMNERKRVEGVDMGVIRPDGTITWITVSAEPVFDSDLGVIIVYFDITRRMLIKEALHQARNDAEEASLAKSRFLTVVAHEFRTPLALLSLSVDILDRYWERLSREERQERHKQLRNAEQQLAALVDSVLVFSRQKTPGIFEDPIFLDVGEVFRTVAEEIISVWGAEHTFTIDIAPECGRHLLIDTQFQKVISNLLTNAIRFTPSGGTIVTCVSLNGNRLVIEVTDTGIGIPDEEQQKVFEAFYRGSNINARNGLGLGLSIVSEAVHLMNGSIAVTSKVGQGSTFRVELPV